MPEISLIPVTASTGGVIEVVPRRGYWGNWNWEESCIRIPKTAGITLANGTFTMWDNGTVNIGFRPDIVVYWDEIGTLGLLSYYPSATTFFCEHKQLQGPWWLHHRQWVCSSG